MLAAVVNGSRQWADVSSVTPAVLRLLPEGQPLPLGPRFAARLGRMASGDKVWYVRRVHLRLFASCVDV